MQNSGYSHSLLEPSPPPLALLGLSPLRLPITGIPNLSLGALSKLFASLCFMSSCPHILGGDRVFFTLVIFNGVCDPKNVKNRNSLGTRNQIFLPSLALGLHLLNCQGVCIGVGEI